MDWFQYGRNLGHERVKSIFAELARGSFVIPEEILLKLPNRQFHEQNEK